MKPYRKLISLLTNFKLQLTITMLFFVILLTFYIINPYTFTNIYTYKSMLTVAPFTIIPALSLTLIIIAGEIDLSFASVMALGSLVMVQTWKTMGEASPLGVLLGLLAGLTAGLLNGVLIAKIKIPSLITTIGTYFFWRGVVLVATNGFSIPISEYRGTPIYELFVGRIAEIPAQFFWTIVLSIVLWLILNRHKFGAHIYYIGDNREAARMVGINVEGVLIAVFAIHGMIVALGGIINTLEMGSFWPSLGDIYMLKSVATVVIGGTPVTGGIGTIYGTLIGGFILEFIEMGILASGVTGFWIMLVHGAVIVIALVAQSVIRRIELAKAMRMRLELAAS